MRTEKEMFDLILGFADKDPRVRLVGMEGSRTNANIPRDEFQDYDISYLVTEMASFKESDDWLDIFGKRVIMQKPEDMALFPPEWGNWFSYLMLFEDGTRIDLTLIPVEELDDYLKGDGLLKILLDKDGRVDPLPTPTDEKYWIQEPSAAFFDDCCNEFWWVSTYVAKGLWRDELLFASHHLERFVRAQLLTMLSWQVGIEHGFGFSVGKNFKYIRRYLTDRQWDLLMRTYRLDSPEACWRALHAAYELFRETSRAVGESFGYPYPDYDVRVTAYVHRGGRS